MYRYLLVLLCPAVAPAPQATDSDITYVRLQAPVEAPRAPSHFRESRIENLPLTIPGNITFGRPVEISTEKNTTEVLSKDISGTSDLVDDGDTILKEGSDLSETVVLPDKDDRSSPGSTDLYDSGTERTDLVEGTELVERKAVPEGATLFERTSVPDTELPEQNGLPVITDLPETTGLPDRKASTGGTNIPVRSNLSRSTNLRDTNLPDKTDLDDELLEAHGSDKSDSIPSDTFQSERRGRTYESGETTEISAEVTERYAQIPYGIDPPQVYENVVDIQPPRTRTLPKYAPKSSFFPNPRPFGGYSKNSIEKAGKRFHSHCRCEKIWNCQKLQISVARCPDEYFLCCF